MKDPYNENKLKKKTNTSIGKKYVASAMKIIKIVVISCVEF